jgi:hypothetical protein
VWLTAKPGGCLHCLHPKCEAGTQVARLLGESVPSPLPKIADAADYLMAELDTSHPLVWIDCEVRQRILQIAELR